MRCRASDAFGCLGSRGRGRARGLTRRPARAFVAIATLVCLTGQGPTASFQESPGPTFEPLSAAGRVELVARLRENLWRDRQLAEQYTYLERRRDVRVSKLGKVSLGPARTFEVYPSSVPGRTYKRLIEVDGVPLSPSELERRDVEHRSNMIWEKQRREQETPAQRLERERRDQQRSDRQRRELLEAFGAFDVVPTGRERLDGHPAPLLRLSLSPRRDAPAHSDLVKYLKRFEGTAWVDTAVDQLVRVDLRALEDVTVGWGLVGRVHKGSTASYERRRVNGEVWLPWRARLSASGRALLFRGFEIETETTWWDYRKYSVEATIVGPKGQ